MIKILQKDGDNCIVLIESSKEEKTAIELIELAENDETIQGLTKDGNYYIFDADGSKYHSVMKGYKFRLYPTDEQKVFFAKSFGCVRFLHNKMLGDKIAHYKEKKENLYILPSKYKDEFPFLKEIDSKALCAEAMNLDRAYQNFFRNPSFGLPKFKSRKDHHNSYQTVNQRNSVRFEKKNGIDYVRLPKVGNVEIRLSQPVLGPMKTVTITQTPSNKYFFSCNVKTWIQELPKTEKELDVELGIDVLVRTSDGQSFDNAKELSHYRKRIKRLQKQLSKKQKDSKNYEKQRIKLARAHERVVNLRKDRLHRLSHKLVDEANLNVEEVTKVVSAASDADSLVDASLYEFKRQLQYKGDWYGRQVSFTQAENQ